MTLTEFKNELTTAAALIEVLDTKYTKANSKRLRASINNIQKSAVEIKKALITTDKSL